MLKSEILARARGEAVLPAFHLAGGGEGVNSGRVGFGAQPTASRAPDGTIWFSTSGGLLAVQPADPADEPGGPHGHDRGRNRGWQSDEPRPGNHPAAGTRSLSIGYAAPSFIQPAHMAFRYRLVGHDHDWVNADNRRTAYYTNIKPATTASR